MRKLLNAVRSGAYQILVNAKPGIAWRYHKAHDGAAGVARFLSWGYLLWLNFACYVLFCRFLGRKPAAEIYEQKRLPCRKSESKQAAEKSPGLSVECYVRQLSAHDVISFDVFDTLIFRPLAQPADLFWFVGGQLGYMDFQSARIQAERRAREKKRNEQGHAEVSFAEIWQELARETGLSAEEGMRVEQETEMRLCYANPFMLAVWECLKKMGKRLIAVSDMYLPQAFVEELLVRNGFTGAEKVYVSCSYGKSKAAGELYDIVRADLGRDNVIHVGDDPHSDRDMAWRSGFAVCPYPGIRRDMFLYRAFDMSDLVGSAYRGIVSARLYSGCGVYSMAYEYGFVYGGLFVLGYCGFLHAYYHRERLDKLLFLARDGDILKQVYDWLYPEDRTAYALWSRKAALKLTADADRRDYFRRFIAHKAGQGYTIRQILAAMELSFLEKNLSRLSPAEELTGGNAERLREFVEAHWDKVIASYREQREAAERYYRELLAGCARVAAADIGWAGSGALALSRLVEREWGLPCSVRGIVAGTNTPHNAEPDASEPFLQSGRLTAYLFSQRHNRDVLKKHDPNRGYNVFWELLLSSPEPAFEGFYADGPHFGAADVNPAGIREIQRGILDFVHDYTERFQYFPYMFHISGRDAYAPMLAAAGHGERYLRAIAAQFDLRINVE